MMNATQLKAQLARMSAETSHYDERLAHLSDIERARAQAIDERDVARQDATYWQARAERAEARVAELDEEETELLKLKSTHEAQIGFMQQELDDLRARFAELEAQLAAAQPAIEVWSQHQADNERQEKLQEEMIAEGLIKRPFWQ